MGKSRKSSNIEKRRRLSELYVEGDEVRFNKNGVVGQNDVEPSDLDVVIWVQPPNPLQREEAVRAAQSARSRAMLAVKDEETRNYLEAEEFVSDLSREDMENYLVDAQTRDVRQRAMRDVLSREEWEDFTVLQDSMREWEEAGFPEGEEWEPLIRRDEEYGNQIKERVKEIIEDTREGLKLIGDEELRRRAKKRFAESLGNEAFMQAYERHMLFYGCRDDEDHELLFFSEVNELQQQPEFVQVALANKLAEYISEPAEAKNSRRAAPGSTQQEPPTAQETSEASTPEEQSA